MKFNCECECGKRFQQIIENPTENQVAEDMYNGFIYVNCEGHND
jgi:hypothetical protein